MQSNNPVFSRSEEFNTAHGNQTYADGHTRAMDRPATPTPSTWSTGAPGQPGPGRPRSPPAGR